MIVGQHHAFRTLAEDPNDLVRRNIAHHKNLPDEVKHHLAADRDPVVRDLIAKYPKLPDDVAHTLATDESEVVRKAIAKREDLPEDLIHTLSADEHKNVREAIAKRKDLPDDVIHTLAADKDYDVRHAIAERPDLPKELTLHPVTRPSDGLMNYSDKDGNILLRNWVEKAEPFKDGKANIVYGGIKMSINTEGRIISKEEKQKTATEQHSTGKKI